MSIRAVAAAVASSQLRRRWRSLVLIGLLAGMIGGVATASVSGARRSSTAYDRLLEATDFPDAFVQVIGPASGVPDQVMASAAVARAIPSTFAVGRDASERNQVLLPLQASSEPVSDLVLVDGRAPDPSAAEEVTVSENLADAVGLRVGDTFAYDGLSAAEFTDLFRDRWDGSATGLRIDLRVVGISRSPTDAVLGDFPTLVGTPAVAQLLDADPTDATLLWVRLRPGSTADDLRADLDEAIGAEDGPLVEVVDLGAERPILDDAVVVLVWGLLTFGAVALLAGAVVVAQLVGRTTERSDDEASVLRVLGADRRGVLLATSASAAVAIGTAAVVSVVVAAAASRWTPIGAAREVEPSPGVEWNLPVLAAGAVATGALLTATFLVGGHRRRRSRRPAPARPGRVSGLLPELLRTGPLGSVATAAARNVGGRRTSGLVAFAGVIVGVGGVVAVSLFGASLDRLTGDPAWWGAIGDHLVEVPEPIRDRTKAALDGAAEVEAYGEIGGSTAIVGGRRSDAYRFEAQRGEIAPVVVRGRLPGAGREVALGPSLLEDLDLELGDRVDVDGESATVVGSVLTFGLSDRSSVTEGALLGGAMAGPNEFTTLVVRYRGGVDAERAARELYGDLEFFVPSPPADVANLAALRPLPPRLVALLAMIGLGALLHAGFGVGSRGRRDLAVLRSLGMRPVDGTKAVVGATALVMLGAAAIGVPLGVVVGRSAWIAVAGTTGLASDVRVPPALLLLLPGLVLVTLVTGTASGRRAVRRGVPEVLRAE